MARDESGQPFAYQPLDQEQRQFRLLRLVRYHEGVIECTLRSLALRDASNFSALSYCWGTDSATHMIQVDGRPFSVRTNLHSFLVQLAEARFDALSNTEWIFIDAICIDQSNLQERAAQVLLMRDIYRKADQVITWLRAEENVGKADVNEDVMFAALTNPYWTRMWVVQEMVAAKSLIIVIDQHRITWQALLHHVEHANQQGIFGPLTETILAMPEYTAFAMDAVKSVDKPDETIPMMAATRMLNFKRKHDAKNPDDRELAFFEAINLFSTQRCQLIHDKAYALFGLSRSHFPPDYTIPRLDLYAQLLTAYLISLGFARASDPATVGRHYHRRESDINGHTIFWNLDLDPLDPAVYIVTRTVLSSLGPSHASLCLHAALLTTWLRTFHNNPDARLEAYDTHDADPAETEPQKRIRGRIKMESDSLAYTRDSDRRLEQKRREDVVLAAPEGGQARRVSEWEAMARERSEDVWTREREDEDLMGFAYSGFSKTLEGVIGEVELEGRVKAYLQDSEAERRRYARDGEGEGEGEPRAKSVPRMEGPVARAFLEEEGLGERVG